MTLIEIRSSPSSLHFTLLGWQRASALHNMKGAFVEGGLFDSPLLSKRWSAPAVPLPMSRGILWKPPLKILVGLLPMPVRVQDPYRIGVSCSLGRNISANWTWVSYFHCLCPSGHKTPIGLGFPISWLHCPLSVPVHRIHPWGRTADFRLFMPLVRIPPICVWLKILISSNSLLFSPP